MAGSDEPSVIFSDAFKARLEDRTSYKIYVGEVEDPKPEYPYLVVWMQPVRRPAYVLKGYAGEIASSFQVTAVATNYVDCLGAADRASKALHRWTPAVAGYKSAYVESDDFTIPPRPEVDRDLIEKGGRRVYFVPLLFSLEASAAAP